MGFSRAGATSNLTAKELVDTYQPKGNVVYGYHFEAPQGGVSNLVNKARNYNSIHNVINAGDVVPQVAMVTMNFQRYGVDHFVPGSKAGTPTQYYKRYAGVLSDDPVKDLEGKSSSAVYTKDNDIWYTRSAEYNAQRAVMKKQLEASSENIPFDDYFHLATFTVKGAFMPEGYVQEVGSSNLHIEDWEQDLLYYLMQWTGLKRSTYVTSNTQNTARDAFKAVMNDQMHVGNITDKLGSNWYIALGLFLKDAVTFTSDREIVENIVDNLGILDDDCIPLKKDEVVPLLDLLANMLNGDMTKLKNYPNARKTLLGRDSILNYGANSEYLVQFATVIFNMYTIGLNHYPEVCYAWLRSYDDYYLKDAEVSGHVYFINTAKDEQVDAPYLTYELNGVPYTLHDGEEAVYSTDDVITEMRLHLTERNSGGAIYYTVDAAGGEKAEFYHQGTNVMMPESHVINAYSMWYSTPSKTASFVFKEDESDYTVYLSGEAVLTTKAGSSVKLVLPQKEYNDLVGAKWDPEHQPEVTLNGTIYRDTYNFVMPHSDVYLVPVYEQKKVQAPVTNVTPGTYAYDQLITLSTPSGTEAEGFEIRYVRTAEYKDGAKETVSGNSGTMLLDSYDNSVVTWTVQATAHHEGWLDSDTSTFVYTIDPTLREYFVVTENCTLPGGVSAALYHPGETVVVTYELPDRCELEGWVIDPANLAYVEDKTARQMTFTMPFDDVTVEAVFSSPTPYRITVERGTAYDMSGKAITEAAPGAWVRIVADTPKMDAGGKPVERFSGWTGTGTSEERHFELSEALFRVPVDGSVDEAEGIRLTANFDTLYVIDAVNAVVYNADGIQVDRAAAGENLTAEVDVPKGAVFDHWSFSPEIGYTDSGSAAAFVMPASALTVEAVMWYPITVIGGSAYNAKGDVITGSLSGETVYLKADKAPAGMTFVSWEFLKGRPTAAEFKFTLIARAEAEGNYRTGKNSFVMPREAVVVKAVYVKIPNTGDEANVGLWTALLLLSACGCVLLMKGNRKRKR